jgi:DNA-binding MarR family transcriptional regulator
MSKRAAPRLPATRHICDACLCLNAQRAARALARSFDDAFRPLGITSGQFSLLVSLNRPTPAPIGAVAALLAMDRTTLTANLKPLERRGLLLKSVARGDRRARVLALTLAGRRLLAAAVPVWRRQQRAIEAATGAPAARVRRQLRALAAAPGKCGQARPIG